MLNLILNIYNNLKHLHIVYPFIHVTNVHTNGRNVVFGVEQISFINFIYFNIVIVTNMDID